MCNSFQPAELRAAAGRGRGIVAMPMFPAVLSEAGELVTSGSSSGAQRTVLGDQAVAAVLTAAGIRTELVPDMDAWLRSHVAFAAPLLAMAARVAQQGGAGLSWGQAYQHARAVAEGVPSSGTCARRLC